MSLDAVIGRIDQILQLQQQVADPTAAAPAATSTSTGATQSGGAASTSFADMLAGAQSGGSSTATADATSAGLTDPISSGVSDPLGATLAGVGTTSGVSTGALPSQVQSMVQEANSLVGKPYVWGGGHGGWGPQTGYDCSGFVSAVLHAGGYLSTPQDTTSLPSAAGMARGPGQYVTVYDRTGVGEAGHVIIDINGQFYESGGGHGVWGGGGGVEKIGRPSASYLATFDTILHPQGL